MQRRERNQEAWKSWAGDKARQQVARAKLAGERQQRTPARVQQAQPSHGSGIGGSTSHTPTRVFRPAAQSPAALVAAEGVHSARMRIYRDYGRLFGSMRSVLTCEAQRRYGQRQAAAAWLPGRRRRMFVLQGEVLCCVRSYAGKSTKAATNDDETDPDSVVAIDIRKASLTVQPPRMGSDRSVDFTLTPYAQSPHTHYFFTAPDADEADAWIAALRQNAAAHQIYEQHEQLLAVAKANDELEYELRGLRSVSPLRRNPGRFRSDATAAGYTINGATWQPRCLNPVAWEEAVAEAARQEETARAAQAAAEEA